MECIISFLINKLKFSLLEPLSQRILCSKILINVILNIEEGRCGIETNGEIVFAACDEENGRTHAQVDKMLRSELGAVHTLMLDGGGSASFFAEGELKIANHENGGTGRNVPSAFEVRK